MLQPEKLELETMMRLEGQPLPLPQLPQSEQATLPPVVICPTEVDNVNITLEKNQQCACKDCGKLFNSVWYLKQHAVKHSNDRPFRCKFCLKTYKFRSNLYQHKCPDRIKSSSGKRFMSRGMSLQPQVHDDSETEGAKSLIPEYQSQAQQFHNQNYASNMCMTNVLAEYGEYNGMPKDEMNSGEEKLVETSETEAEHSSVTSRKKPLDQAVIDDYIQRNKHKLFPCRKCRIQFPSREYLSRHTVYHNESETLVHKCRYCPQRYPSEKALSSHLEVHTTESNFVCSRCSAPFKSMLALRRHKDRCRECTAPPFGAPVDCLSMPASSTFDEYAFIDAEEAVTHLNICMLDEDVVAVKGPDSGLGSEGSNHSYTTSPARSSVHLEDDEGFEVEAKRSLGVLPKLRITIPPKMSQEKKKKEEENEPDFRTRFNSITQSGPSSGTSNFSSDGNSPTRRMSVVEIHDQPLNSYSPYNSFMSTSHGQITSGTHTYASESNIGDTRSPSDVTVSSFSSGSSRSTEVLLPRIVSFTPSLAGGDFLINHAVLAAKSDSQVLAKISNTTLQQVCNDMRVETNLCVLKSILFRKVAAQWAVLTSVALFKNLVSILISSLLDGLICAPLLLGEDCISILQETMLDLPTGEQQPVCEIFEEKAQTCFK